MGFRDWEGIFLSWNGVNSQKNSRNDISLVTGLEGEGGKGDYRGIGEGGVENGDCQGEREELTKAYC